MKKIKLSKKQKEVIQFMRNNPHLKILYSRFVNDDVCFIGAKDKCHTIPINIATISAIWRLELFTQKKHELRQSDWWLTLNELGKTINL